jgi:hypothetical protein
LAELTDEQKLEVVTRLARWDTPAEIMHDFRSREIDVSHKQIGSYDPTRSYYEAGDQWAEIFHASRKAFLEAVSHIPCANQSYRLQVLQKGIDASLKAGKYPTAAALAEQASKEVGGAYSNERNVNINDARRPNPRDLSPEERKNALAEAIRAELEKIPVPGAEPQHVTQQ